VLYLKKILSTRRLRPLEDHGLQESLAPEKETENKMDKHPAYQQHPQGLGS
jgi:hypothetical protein